MKIEKISSVRDRETEVEEVGEKKKTLACGNEHTLYRNGT